MAVHIRTMLLLVVDAIAFSAVLGGVVRLVSVIRR
jgi:hypothetical protein